MQGISHRLIKIITCDPIIIIDISINTESIIMVLFYQFVIIVHANQIQSSIEIASKYS